MSLGLPSAGSGYPPSEASAAGVSPERSEHCEAMSLEVCSMRGVATPVLLLLLLFSMLKTILQILSKSVEDAVGDDRIARSVNFAVEHRRKVWYNTAR